MLSHRKGNSYLFGQIVKVEETSVFSNMSSNSTMNGKAAKLVIIKTTGTKCCG
jgi:hypothetical protein